MPHADPNVLKRRRHPRRSFVRSIGILQSGTYDLGMAMEVSEGGMLIQGFRELDPSRSVVLSFLVPGKDFVMVRAKLIYKNSEGAYGVQFLNLRFENRRLIRDYIAAKSAEEAKQEAQKKQGNVV